MRLILLILLFVAWHVSGYDNLVIHPSLTQGAIKIFKQSVGKDLTQEKINWIVEGSIAEDTDPRYLNHFYNPETGEGFSGIVNIIGFLGIKRYVEGIPAKQWAREQGSATGDYSESAILKNYKEGDIKRAYQGVGHILHLIQDMSVPAHTRIGNHQDGDPYEKWAEQYGQPNLNKAGFIDVQNLDNVFDELAGYSYDNFFSKDTIAIHNKNMYIAESKLVDGKKRVYLLKNLNDIQYKFVYTQNPDSINPVFQVDGDFNLNLDYWNMLSPKAVGYSAGVIDYFIRQFEEIDKEKEKQNLSLWDKTKTSFSNLTNNLKYNWGDTFLATRVQAKESWKYAVGKGNEGKNNFQFFAEANKETIVNTAQKSAKVAASAIDAGGKVLSAVDAPIVLGSIFGINPSEGAGKNINKEDVKAEPALEVSEPSFLEKISPEETSSPAEEIIIQPAPRSNFIFLGGDGVPPDTTISNYPESISSSTEANFLFTASEANARFEYNLDNSGWQNSENIKIFADLSEGDHNIDVRAIDSSNNIDQTPGQYSWLVDTLSATSSVDSLNEEYDEIGFAIGWQGNDAGSGVNNYDIEYKINNNDWENWLSATTSASAIFDVAVEAGSNIYFRARANDKAGNMGEWSLPAQTKIKSDLADHLVISEIKIAGATATDEFVELYNPTDSVVDLSAYKLKRKSSGGVEYLLVSNFGADKILAHGYYLIVHPTGYAGAPTADITYSSASYSIAPDNAVILYSGDEVIDKIGFGNASDFETLAYLANPSSSQSLERKASKNSTAESMAVDGGEELGGNGFDGDDNSLDFVLQNAPNPQNSFSSSEPRDSQPIAPSAINDLIIQHNYTTNTSVKLSWTSPNNASLSEGAYHDLRYKKKNGNCDLLTNWNSALKIATSSLPIPASSSGQNQSIKITGLDPGSSYCFAVKTYNGEAWSNISNQISKTTLASSSSCSSVPLNWNRLVLTQTLTADKSPYCVLEDRYLNLDSNSVLTIEPGVVLKMGKNTYITMSVSASLIARGTKENPIIFTSLKDDSFAGDSNGDVGATNPSPGDWRGINSNANTILDHVVVRYGGAFQDHAVFVPAPNSITNSEFSHNSRSVRHMYNVGSSTPPAIFEYNSIHDNSAGVMVDLSANPSIRYNNFYNNFTGIHVRLNSVPIINNNNFSGNTTAVEAANNYVGADVNARGNYWGDASGPTHETNPGGAGDKVSNRIDFGDFLTEEY